MDEKQLLRISFFVSLVGLILLYFMAKNIEVSEIALNKAGQVKDDEIIRLKGVVNKVSQKDKATVIEISQNSNISIIVFENIIVEKNRTIEVIGKVKDYNGSKEIVAEEINLID